VDIAGYIGMILCGYLLGSIPSGFLMGKARGIDIRSLGSGNIGATNVLRILGKPAGIFVLVLDGLKGYTAASWLVDLMVRLFHLGASQHEGMMILGGVASVLGHNYTCWLRFKGGKGIATSAGVLAALVPWALLIILIIWIVLALLTRYVSIASMAASFALPFASWATGESLTKILVTAAMGALAIYKHRSNFQRLLEGTESRMSLKKREATP
jgi:acyl phosphate:glycerol-3-phosphate acyltransferase